MGMISLISLVRIALLLFCEVNRNIFVTFNHNAQGRVNHNGQGADFCRLRNPNSGNYSYARINHNVFFTFVIPEYQK